MNSPETQPDPDFDITYVDPEQIDMSEQQFAVSLEQPPNAPAFVIEPEEVPRIAQAGPSRHEVTPLKEHRDVRAPALNSEIVSDAGSAPGTSLPTSADASPDWRDLVSEKVNSYRSRRPHKERYPSLQLQFDVEPQRNLRSEDVRSFEDADCSPTADVPAARMPQPVVLESTARVLEFPRPASAPVRIEELAEPVLDRPRIIEAPELLPPPPAMGGILIEAQEEPAAERHPGFDVPLLSATLNRRVLAALADAAVVATAFTLFGYIALRVVGISMPASSLPPRMAMGLAAAMLVVFWAAYQYAFLVFCGKTPGLLATRLEIRRFEGAPASRNLRRWRALASLLSLASLGLGYAWCFMDEDQLSWHDRITRTHLALRDSGQ